MQQAVNWMAEVSGVEFALGPVPDGVEVNPRYGDKDTVYVLVNFAKSQRTVKLPSAMTDVLNGGLVQSITLAHYGVAVVAVPRKVAEREQTTSGSLRRQQQRKPGRR